MGRGLSDLQKSALTLAITLDPDHKRNKWQREVVTAEVAQQRAEQIAGFLGTTPRPVKPEDIDPPHTLYHLQPCELIDHHYCQQVFPSKAQQVAASKALARLVKRGLMVKLKCFDWHRYNLTDAGLAKAGELLTNG